MRPTVRVSTAAGARPPQLRPRRGTGRRKAKRRRLLSCPWPHESDARPKTHQLQRPCGPSESMGNAPPPVGAKTGYVAQLRLSCGRSSHWGTGDDPPHPCGLRAVTAAVGASRPLDWLAASSALSPSGKRERGCSTGVGAVQVAASANVWRGDDIGLLKR